MVRLPQEAVDVISKIISKGNDAEVRKKGDDVIVLEVKKTIKYAPAQSGAGRPSGQS